MPRRKNDFGRGGYYHLYNRGVYRGRIFFNDENYLFCLQRMKAVGRKYGATIIAYCLMPNHYHFLLRQEGDVSLSRFVGALFNGYVQAVNRQQGRSGTLFEGRFRHRYVDGERYLIHLCRYIHANPVRAGLVSTPEAWPYSNYREWVGLRPGTLVDHDFVEGYFPGRDEYAAFVLDYAEGRDPLPEGMGDYLFYA